MRRDSATIRIETRLGRAFAVLVLAFVSTSAAMAQAQPFEIPPGDGLGFFQMNWFYPGGPPIPNSDWGRAVADPQRIAEITGVPSCYLNVVTEEGWVIQNWFLDSSEALTHDGGLPPGKGFGVDHAEQSTYFNLGPDGSPISTLNAQTLCPPNPLLDVDGLLMDPRIYTIQIDFADPSGAGEQDVVAPGDAPPLTPGNYNPLGPTFSFVQPDTVNIDAAINQCFPMSMANSLQWLENRYRIDVPHNHTPGSFGNTLAGRLDQAAMRQGGANPSGVWFTPMMTGKFKYLADNDLEDSLVHKHQGRGYGQMLANGNFSSSGITSEDQGANITFAWICDELQKGEDVELVYRHAQGGHAVQIIGCGMTWGRPWLKYSHDRQQGIPNSGLETPSVWVDDIDGDGQMNFGSATREITFVMAESPTEEVRSGARTPWSFSAALGNAADFLKKHAKGTITAIFGEFPFAGTETKQLIFTEPGGGPITLPTTMNGVRVFVNGRLAPFFSTDPTQLNVQLPYETETGAVTIVIEVNGETTAAFTINVDEVAPALFVASADFAAGRAIAQNFPDFSLNTAHNPIEAGGIVIVYLVGIGEVTNPVPTGQAAPLGGPLSVAANPFSATIGGEDAAVGFLGLTPGAVALGQANITVPPDLPTGDYLVIITVAGVPSNAVLISVVNNG